MKSEDLLFKGSKQSLKGMLYCLYEGYLVWLEVWIKSIWKGMDGFFLCNHFFSLLSIDRKKINVYSQIENLPTEHAANNKIWDHV